MTIGIDVRALAGASGRRGVGVYIRGLVRALAGEVSRTGDEMLLFGDGGGEPVEDAKDGRIRSVRLRRPRRAITVWDQIAWWPLLARTGVTVFHSPFYAVPRWRPARCRIVQTVHDLTPLKIPQSVSPHNQRIFRANFALARGADRIIVPSAATRDDVVSILGLPGDRVAVIPEAADITAADLAAADGRADATLHRLGLTRRFLLHTGGHDPIKNLGGLVGAFAALRARGRDLDLVIVGEHGSQTASVINRAATLGVLERVRLPGYVPRADLLSLYRRAAALVYPSFAEGFGLPVLEAMACGTPVVASGVGALREVGSDACLYVEPADCRSIVAVIESLLDDDALSRRLADRGRQRAASFSWEETARRTMRLYREVAA